MAKKVAKKAESKRAAVGAAAMAGEYQDIPIGQIRPNKWNRSCTVTDDFVESIRVNGILQSPVVRK